jgi:hypothetical protein
LISYPSTNKKGEIVVKTINSVQLTCDDCKKKTITVDSKNLEKDTYTAGWKLESNVYPTSVATIKKVLCPDCVKKEKDRLYNSDSITDRLQTDYYSKNPGLFERDVLVHLGLENHPRRLKLMKVANDKGHSGGYSEIFNEALSLAEILVD